ncbi:hypothetical protein E2C01_086565 [Portunus trituberculatus]|uniref:Uncharacterized protein n=1 Tax=Portunus trituberculatus TaxID=210409 RepID=A0A5B7J5S0_PORTR|nr:hypothetical protein [Portunus trituberculatus]
MMKRNNNKWCVSVRSGWLWEYVYLCSVHSGWPVYSQGCLGRGPQRLSSSIVKGVITMGQQRGMDNDLQPHWSLASAP